MFPWTHDSGEGFLSFLLSQFSGFLKLSISLFEYFLVSAIQLVCWGNVTNSAVQPDSVVMLNVLFYNSAGIVKGKWNTRTNAFSFNGFVESLQFTV